MLHQQQGEERNIPSETLWLKSLMLHQQHCMMYTFSESRKSMPHGSSRRYIPHVTPLRQNITNIFPYGLHRYVRCSATVNSVADGRRTAGMTAVVRAYGGRRTPPFSQQWQKRCGRTTRGNQAGHTGITSVSIAHNLFQNLQLPKSQTKMVLTTHCCM